MRQGAYASSKLVVGASVSQATLLNISDNLEAGMSRSEDTPPCSEDAFAFAFMDARSNLYGFVAKQPPTWFEGVAFAKLERFDVCFRGVSFGDGASTDDAAAPSWPPSGLSRRGELGGAIPASTSIGSIFDSPRFTPRPWRKFPGPGPITEMHGVGLVRAILKAITARKSLLFCCSSTSSMHNVGSPVKGCRTIPNAFE